MDYKPDMKTQTKTQQMGHQDESPVDPGAETGPKMKHRLVEGKNPQVTTIAIEKCQTSRDDRQISG